MPAPKLRTISMHDVFTYLDTLRIAMHDAGYVPARIICLGRGGMVPARFLAEHQPITYWGLASYEGKEKGLIEEYQALPENEIDAESTLLVDDLWDSGQTFQYALDRFPKAKTAALLAKTSGHSLDFVGQLLETDSWLILPWEC